MNDCSGGAKRGRHGYKRHYKKELVTLTDLIMKEECQWRGICQEIQMFQGCVT